jgi:hypothetical protein
MYVCMYVCMYVHFYSRFCLGKYSLHASVIYNVISSSQSDVPLKNICNEIRQTITSKTYLLPLTLYRRQLTCHI